MKSNFKLITIIILAFAMVLSTIAVQYIQPVNAETIDPDNVLVSDEIALQGFQMKTNNNDQCGISFRAICKAPIIGSSIKVGGVAYTVKSVGTSYVLDTNQSGSRTGDVYSKKYTVLNPDITADGTYVGLLDSFATRGFLATKEGEYIGYNSSDKEHVYYVMTLIHMDEFTTNTIHVRAFVVATDASGNEVIIYGSKKGATSIAQIASNIYRNSKAPNYAAHQYLFNAILNNTSVVPKTNPYYYSTEVEYGWSGNVEPGSK